jgi:hypothetical protein
MRARAGRSPRPGRALATLARVRLDLSKRCYFALMEMLPPPNAVVAPESSSSPGWLS